MLTYQKVSLFLLRMTLGWYMLYAGVPKVLNSAWSAAGYLEGAKNFAGFYDFFLTPGMLPVTNFMNAWGITLIGVSLVLGVCVRWSSIAGILLMVLYYFVLPFPQQDIHSYVVDSHFINAVAFFILFSFDAGRVWGLEEKVRRLFRKG